MNKVYLYPFWLRFWHWVNALLYIILIATGISIHYSDTGSLLIPFSVAVPIHNIGGILLLIMYLFFLIYSIISKNYKYYLIRLKTFKQDIFLQMHYYFFGIFDSDKKPFKVSKKEKFNPLQKIAYVGVMFLLTPLVILTGLLLMFPDLSPDEFLGLGGVWPMAVLHTITGFLLSIFMFVHIYLGTTGHTTFELIKAMISGWHHEHEDVDEAEQEYILNKKREELKKIKGKLFPPVVYNPITLTGAFISLVSFGLILFLIIVEFFAAHDNPYVGIVTFLILPAFLLIGLLLIFFGIFRENRIIMRKKDERRMPVIDLNNTKHQVAILVFSIGTVILAVFSAFGSYKAYEYTETDEFCGTVCHVVMEPQYVTYQNSAHSRVGCVKCHIGSGADWYVRSKLSGIRQVFAVMNNSFPRPIPTPVENLRPAQETCEQCHWPKHFYDEKRVLKDYFLTDKNNSHYKLEMNLKVGGGNSEMGNTDGIHWHMNLANDIIYYHTDHSRQDIPWIKVKSKINGKETVYKTIDFNLKLDTIMKSKNLRTFDCIDCHNRPSHKMNPSPQIVNLYMSIGKIDKDLPYIKSVSLQALESKFKNKADAFKTIHNFVWNYYNTKFPEIDENQKKSINKAVHELSSIYQKNYFPEMKVSWRNFPDNIGHLHSQGCFRCHDGKHVSPEGKVLTNDCNACHTFKTEVIPDLKTGNKVVINDFVHPGGDDKQIKSQNCVFCHGVKHKKPLANAKK